ncbi:hypothetical protein Tco_1328770 [Tanacetum coccineum]
MIVRGPSPIVTSNGISPNSHDSSPKNSTRGLLESTQRDLTDGFNFRKQCSYITSHELPLSKYALFTCLPDMYTLITSGSDEPSFGMGGNVIYPVPLSLEDFLGLLKLSLRSFETPLVATSLASTRVYDFSIRPLFIGLRASLKSARVSVVSGNEGSGAFVFPLFDVMYSQMCLCKHLLLAKVQSELCFEVLVIKDATCFLTIPPYSGRVFEGIGSYWDPISRHRNQYGKAFSIHL